MPKPRSNSWPAISCLKTRKARSRSGPPEGSSPPSPGATVALERLLGQALWMRILLISLRFCCPGPAFFFAWAGAFSLLLAGCGQKEQEKTPAASQAQTETEPILSAGDAAMLKGEKTPVTEADLAWAEL